MKFNIFIKKILHFLPILAIFLIVGELILANELAALNASAQKIDTTITTLRDENEKLTIGVATASSLLTLVTKSKQLGFVDTAPTLNLEVTNPVAFAQANP